MADLVFKEIHDKVLESLELHGEKELVDRVRAVLEARDSVRHGAEHKDEQYIHRVRLGDYATLFSLEEAIYKFSTLDCTEKHDGVYALLGISHQDPVKSFEVRYD